MRISIERLIEILQTILEVNDSEIKDCALQSLIDMLKEDAETYYR